jgi:hypothetical protein
MLIVDNENEGHHNDLQTSSDNWISFVLKKYDTVIAAITGVLAAATSYMLLARAPPSCFQDHNRSAPDLVTVRLHGRVGRLHGV